MTVKTEELVFCLELDNEKGSQQRQKNHFQLIAKQHVVENP